MIDNSFMLGDVTGILAALCLFPLFLLIPGYVLGWCANVLSFRQRIITTKITLSIALSVAVCPIVTYLLARLFSFNLVWVAYAITWVIFLKIVAGSLRGSGHHLIAGIKENWLPLLLVAGWIILATLSLSDLQLGKNLYISLVSYDYTKHVAVTAAISRTGIPPINPSFFPGHPLELYYYYFWFLMCSLVDRLGGALISPRIAVIAGTIWSGIALMAVVLLYLRFLEPNGKQHIRTKAVVGIALLIITGLDIVPVLAEVLLKVTTGRGQFNPDMEWWNPQMQVTAWLGAMLWVPHHVTGLVATLTGMLLFRSVRNTAKSSEKLSTTLISGLAFASAIGLSIWVTFVSAVILSVWMLISILKKWRREVVLLSLIGLVAILLSIPFLLDLHAANHLINVKPIALTIRTFGPVLKIFAGLGIKGGLVKLTNLLFLPLNYFIELGFFAIAAIFYWKERLNSGNKPNREDIFKIVILSTSIIICTFLKANLRDNDLGWRGFMFAQFILLIWSVDLTISLFYRIFKRKKVEALPVKAIASDRIRNFLALLLILGVLSTVYDLTMLRAYPVLTDRHGNEMGKKNYAIRQVYQWINNKLPVAAIVQHNPNLWVDHFHGLYGNHQVVVADHNYGTLYGIPESFYQPVASSVSKIFLTNIELNQVDEICKNFSIDSLVIKPDDKVWQDNQTWVWRRKPMFSNDFSKVFTCGRLAEEMRAMSTQ